MAFAPAPLVSVGIPLYRSQRFIERVARNVEAIDYPNVEVIVSDRHSEDDALDILAARFQQDRRVRTIKAADGLTWVQHYNQLLREASGTYFMWMPHDDEFPSDYLSQLVAALEAHPEAVLAYGRIERVDLDGRSLGTSRQYEPVVAGKSWSPRSALGLIIRRQTEEPFRGVFRRDVVVRSSLSIRSSLDEMSADAYWVFGLALLGPLHLVPDCSCRKAYYSSSTHAQWGPMRLRHIVNGRRVLLSYVQSAIHDRRDASDCASAVNLWTLLAIAGVTARHWGIPAGLRRSTQLFLSRVVAPD